MMQSPSASRMLPDKLPGEDKRLPVLFIGHGSPMNAIELNEFSLTWREVGKRLPKPKCVLCVSAHWETPGTFVTAMGKPKTIHDFQGFSPELSTVRYPAPGAPELAEETQKFLNATTVGLDFDWGLDHGCWSVMNHLYPDADVPVVQLSLDYTKPAPWHYELAKGLAPLRREGVLILGSGNIVHNLRVADWGRPRGGYEWAEAMNQKFKNLILDDDHKSLTEYSKLGKDALLSVPTPEHYLPLLYVLAVKETNDGVSLLNDHLVMGSISMTSVMLDET